MRTAGRLVLVWLVLLAVGYAAGRVITDAHPSWDASLVNALRGSEEGALTTTMRFVTQLGGTVVLDIVFLVAMAVLLVRRCWRDALFLLLASPATVLLVQILKGTVNRPRPLGHHLAASQNASWPSGHASSSIALYGAILLILLAREPFTHGETARWFRTTAIGSAVTLVALIGFSRVYLGVHYPTDVLAAWVLVVGWLTVLEHQVGHSRGRAKAQAANHSPTEAGSTSRPVTAEESST